MLLMSFECGGGGVEGGAAENPVNSQNCSAHIEILFLKIPIGLRLN